MTPDEIKALREKYGTRGGCTAVWGGNEMSKDIHRLLDEIERLQGASLLRSLQPSTLTEADFERIRLIVHGSEFCICDPMRTLYSAPVGGIYKCRDCGKAAHPATALGQQNERGGTVSAENP